MMVDLVLVLEIPMATRWAMGIPTAAREAVRTRITMALSTGMTAVAMAMGTIRPSLSL